MDPSSWSCDLSFTLKRRETELVTPAKPTPREMKPLSDIDDQDGLRFLVPLIFFYRGGQPFMAGKDPAIIIRNALSQILVSYYPLAGRLRELAPNRKLMVDCTGEGVLFTQADADVTLDQFGPNLQPPFPCFQQLLFTLPASQEIINSPLLHIQVTLLKCGGFIFALAINHTMSDALGVVQFLTALSEIARGAFEPSISPVWRRELLTARNPPCITCTHREYQTTVELNQQPNHDDDDPLVQRSFFFERTKIEAFRELLPHHLRNSTIFEILTALFWRCRTIALKLHPNDDVRLMVITNLRSKSKSVVPVGYYGNVFVYPAAVTSVGRLCDGNSIGYAVEMVKKSKGDATQEYMQSVTDMMVIRCRPCFITERSWIVSNLTRVGFRDVDFGWGKAVYAGVPKAGGGDFPGISFFVAHKNGKGEEGVIIPLCLPSKVMQRFVKELDHMLQHHNNSLVQDYGVIRSSL